ncbi:hypothetical protein AB1Y20_014177 [Prymnesium parvum]|uniref:CRM domain-containing protein n=1 Tax=Prymnesium parvum TaxID=97485 RepID=A0AB34IFG8_PRYPA
MRPWLLLLVLLLTHAGALSLGGTLSGKQKRQLRAVAARLASAKQLRSVIVTDTSRSAADVSAQLDSHELVRARFPRAEKKKEAAALAEELIAQVGNAVVAEVLGHTALLYRPSHKRIIDLDS